MCGTIEGRRLNYARAKSHVYLYIIVRISVGSLNGVNYYDKKFLWEEILSLSKCSSLDIGYGMKMKAVPGSKRKSSSCSITFPPPLHGSSSGIS